MSAPADNLPSKPALAPGLTEVRYSLPELLAEVLAERRAPAYANEQLEQVEIGKLFQRNRPNRAARNKE